MGQRLYLDKAKAFVKDYYLANLKPDVPKPGDYPTNYIVDFSVKGRGVYLLFTAK